MSGGDQRIWPEGAEPGVYTPREVTSHIKQLFRATDKLEASVEAVKAEQTRQGLTLAEIRTGVSQLVAVAAGPPPNRCVEYAMRIKAAEERLTAAEEDIEANSAKAQCQGCKNQDKVESLVKFKDKWEPRLWMAIGGLVLLQIALRYAPNFLR